MRILIGVIAFIVWGGISIQWYVCGVKGLCGDKTTAVNSPVDNIQQQVVELNDSTEVDIVTRPKLTVKELAVYFPYAKSKKKLNDSQVDSLKIIVHELKNTDIGIFIYGNTDNRGTGENNYLLGKERAEWMKDMLVSYGLNAEKIKVESNGESQPVYENNTEVGRSKNRRVDIIIKDL